MAEVPQWKKDLILRKRGKTSATTVHTVSSAQTVLKEPCNTSTMVVDRTSVLVMRPTIPSNGDCCLDSDSSEELQYGPGIVSKLKSKYLSLTLRETVPVQRATVLPLRRAASLEQLLDEEPPKVVPVPPRRYTPRIPAAGAVTAPSPRYRAQQRRNGTEQVKRARSVETISRNENIEPVRKPVRPLRIAPVLDQNERPPADHVKQTLKLFEGPALKRTKQPVSTGDVAAKVACYKQIIQQHKPPPAPPMPTSPKPTILHPKPVVPPKKIFSPPQSPVKNKQDISPIPDVLDAAAGLCPTPDLIVHSSPQSRPFSPQTLQDVTSSFLKNEIKHSQNTTPHIPTPTKVKSPDIPKVLSRSPSPKTEPVTSKEVSKQAVENISKAGHTITYKFDTSSPKSHLPRLNSVPVRIKLVPDTIPSPPLKPNIPEPPKPKPPQKITNGRPTTQPPKVPLTSREIEKNSINKMKTLEQPVSKVVVAMRSVDEVVAKKVKPKQQETTILFDFSKRDSIPDYIATDGRTSSRGKREKPKPGESGIILLPGAPAEEFADDEDDWMLSLNGPPSPCDVHFVNDNILIDGKSSISKHPKRQKLRIQFNDDATQVFEYLSEASALEDTSQVVTSPPTSHPVPSLTGSSLSNYTPLKMPSGGFELGVDRVVTSPPSSTAAPPAGVVPLPADEPVTYSAETTADILF